MNNDTDINSANTDNNQVNENVDQQINSSFDHVNAQQSAAIFRQFNQGKVITKQLFDQINAKITDNALFTCLFNSPQQKNFWHTSNFSTS